MTGIRAKVALLALLCAVLPAALISITAFMSAREQFEKSVNSELSRIVDSELARIQGIIESASRDLSIWSSLHTMQNVLLDDEDGSISDELARLHDQYPRFGLLLVANSGGRVVAASDSAYLGTDLRSTDVLRASLAAPFQSDVHVDDLTGSQTIAMSFPIRADYDEMTSIGVLVGLVDWERVQAELARVEIWGSVQDENHRLALHSSSGALVFGSEPVEIHGIETRQPHPPTVEKRMVAGTPFLVGTAQNAESGWMMHAMIAESVAFADVAELGFHIGTLSSAIIIVAVLIGAYVSGRSIVAPISAVTSAMSSVAKGETDINLEGRERRDEIGQMLSAIATFRRKLLHDNHLLQQSQDALKEQNVRFDSALTHMSQGLSMFDADGNLTVCNPQFGELYRLPSEVTRAGTSIAAMIADLIAREVTSPAEAEEYRQRALENAHNGVDWDQMFQMQDGTEIFISHRPMPGGGWVATHADVTERRRAEAQILHMSRHDALTGLPNRVLFRGEIERALATPSRAARVAVLCLDLDRFKTVNDSLGHPVGDVLLKQVADRLRRTMRDGAIAARLGGDEFAVICSDTRQPEGAITLARSIISELSSPFEVDGHQIDIGASVGIAVAPGDGSDADTLLKNADLALYRAKADGGNTYRLFEREMDERIQARRALEIDLRAALQHREFKLVYQPLVDVKSEQIIGFEALVRWLHPSKGLISPADFIPIAEETGLIIPLGEWILEQACSDAARWPANIRIAINLSPAQFRSPNLLRAVFNALAASKLSATRLDLEITETVLIRDSQATLATLHQLREIGVRISMDDFGTGYSSLSYLQKFPFSKIKIDQSFIRGLGSTEESLAIVRAVTGMSRSLGMITTAEGVETAEQLQTLRNEGCNEVQGYLISRPQSFEDATKLLRRGSAAIHSQDKPSATRAPRSVDAA